MKTTNFKIKKNNCIYLNAYNILVISLIVFTILLAIFVWIWYGYKDAQIENELIHIK